MIGLFFFMTVSDESNTSQSKPSTSLFKSLIFFLFEIILSSGCDFMIPFFSITECFDPFLPLRLTFEIFFPTSALIVWTFKSFTELFILITFSCRREKKELSGSIQIYSNVEFCSAIPANVSPTLAPTSITVSVLAINFDRCGKNLSYFG